MAGDSCFIKPGWIDRRGGEPVPDTRVFAGQGIFETNLEIRTDRHKARRGSSSGAPDPRLRLRADDNSGREQCSNNHDYGQ